jgi:hypothetical protein
VLKGKVNMLRKFLKSLYGLKQFSHEWNDKINAYFLFKKFERSYVDHNVYFKRILKNSFVIIIFVCWLMILAFNDLTLLKETKDILSKKFQMADFK